MSFWRGETLIKKLPDLIKPFDPESVDCAAYTLRIGNEIYVSPDQEIKNPDRHTRQALTKGESFTIPPGQFAFLLTEEEVTVPTNALALISIKGRIKFKGLINISGFHVDPGYSGRLLFSVLNAGPRPLHLRQGQKLFLIWFADLDEPTEIKKTNRGFREIDLEMVNGISGEILSLQSLSDKQRVLESKMAQQKIKVDILFYVGLALLLPMAKRVMSEIQALQVWLAEVVKSYV